MDQLQSRLWVPFRFWLQQWRRRVNSEEAEKATGKFDDAIQRLAFDPRDYPHTLRALRDTRFTLETTSWWGIIGAAFLVGIEIAAIEILMTEVHKLTEGHQAASIQQGAKYIHDQWNHHGDADTDPLFMAVVMIMLYALPGRILWRSIGRGAYMRYRLIAHTSAAMQKCADALDASTPSRRAPLSALDLACQRVEKYVMRAHRTYGSMPRRSPRRTQARNHSAAVAGALRKQLARLDTEPDRALRDLAMMLAVIGERHAQGLVGALLPEDAIRHVTPVSLARSAVRESFRLALAIAAALAALLITNPVLQAADIQPGLRPWFLAGAAVLAAIAVAGWNRVRQLLEVLPGP